MGTPKNPVSGGVTAPTTPGTPTQPGPSVTFGLEKIGPPSTLYIGRDDQLVMGVIVVNLGDGVIFNYRLMNTAGIILAGQFTVTPTAAGALTLLPQVLSEGYLLSLTARASGTQQRGLTFARVWINRGNPNNANASRTLFADYCTISAPVGWPDGRYIYPTEGPGALQVIHPANPAAGTDWSQGVTNNQRWKVRSLNATLTTSATVANRQPQIILTDTAGDVLFTGVPNANIPATTVAAVTASPVSSPGNLIATDITVPLPGDTVLPATFFIKSLTVGIQVADQWSNIFILVESWIDL